jgi:hypothetical protein
MDDRISSNRALDAALRAVAEDDEPWSASAAVESRLLAAVRAGARARRRRAAAASLLSAAALFLALVLPTWQRTGPDSTAGSAVGAGGSGELATEFFPLAYSLVPAPDGHLVRMQVPRAALQQFGVPSFDAQSVSPTVLADVLVGDDGLARAVRFVRVEISQIEQEQQQ